MFSYTKGTYALVVRHMFAEGLLEEENSIHSKKCRGDPQETRRNTLDLSQVSEN